MNPCTKCGHPHAAHHKDGCHITGCRCQDHEPVTPWWDEEKAKGGE
jgi:hypothetical protein